MSVRTKVLIMVGLTLMVVGVSALGNEAYQSSERDNFKQSFGVDLAGKSPNAQERGLLQGWVSRTIQADRAELAQMPAKYGCDNSLCMQNKLTAFKTQEVTLNNAINTAQHFDFSIPPESNWSGTANPNPANAPISPDVHK